MLEEVLSSAEDHDSSVASEYWLNVVIQESDACRNDCVYPHPAPKEN